jgi:hypothetical protein
VPVPPSWRHCPLLAVYVPEALTVRAVVAVPFRISSLGDCVSWRVNVLPLTCPVISAMVPHEVPLPLRVTCPSKILLLSCVRAAVAWITFDGELAGVSENTHVPVSEGRGVWPLPQPFRKPRATTKAKQTILFMSGSLWQFTAKPKPEQFRDNALDYWMVTVTVFFER